MSAVQGAVSAATQEAREAGEAILASSGNAFDAIVASATALAVTEPGNSGLGGEGYCIFYDASTAQAGSLRFMGVPGGLATPGNLVGKDFLYVGQELAYCPGIRGQACRRRSAIQARLGRA